VLGINFGASWEQIWRKMGIRLVMDGNKFESEFSKELKD